ncbi:hypothetical protein [Cellulosimicrobium funkei]|uniref:hypothetical protein n=1 Tax=Cellulosimicrobium funkei TaxID=264251 RepID=UPI0034408A6C
MRTEPTSALDLAVSRNFRRLLEEKGMTHRQFAAELGITYPQLDHRMRANTSWFVAEVYSAGKILGVESWAALVGRNES